MDNINIYPILVAAKASKHTGECPLYLAIDINRKRAATVSLKRKVLPDQWDADRKEVKKNAPNTTYINALIQKRKQELDGEYLKKQVLGVPLTKQAVNRIARGLDTGQDFIKFCRHQIRITGYEDSTARVYNSEVNKIEQFMPQLTFKDIDFDFLQRYEHYMRSKLNNENNTIWKSFKFLNTMLNQAVKTGGIIDKNPTEQYQKIQYQQGVPEYLEWDEVQKLKQIIIDNKAITEKERTVGYYFLLSCVSGLRFSDAIRFDYDQHVIETEGGKRLVLTMKKTHETVSMSFTRDIAEVVGYLKESPHFSNITNQEYNRILKLLGGIAQLRKPLSSHMGRHSFGMRCAELHMRIEDVQKFMGHKSLTNTKVYFRIKDKRLDESMKVWDTEKPTRDV